MNLTLITLAIAIAGAATTVFADDITPEPPFTSTASRAVVQEELRVFRQGGANPWADDYDVFAHTPSTLTRAQVTAEFMSSRSEVAATTGEDSGSSYYARGQGMQTDPAGTEFAHAE